MRNILKQRKTTVLKNQKGFTLVEMLIVLVLIGLAVAMMVGIFGSPFANASIDSTATRVIDDLRSIEAAAQADKTQKASTPADLAALVTDGYLKITPTAPPVLPNSTYTMATGTYKGATDTIATLDKVNDDICKAINKAAYGATANAAIPAAVDSGKNIQCYGPGTNNIALIPVFVK